MRNGAEGNTPSSELARECELPQPFSVPNDVSRQLPKGIGDTTLKFLFQYGIAQIAVHVIE
jgi:hypothetical protein